LFAGFVNTLAGGGSFLTVPLLVLVGLPPTVANATNRVGVLVQTLWAIVGFRGAGIPSLGRAANMVPAMLGGAWLGALTASHVPDAAFARAFGVLMLLFLPVLLANPRPSDVPVAGLSRLGFWRHGVYLGIGFYAGAVQAGMGIPLLIALVTVGGLDLVRANSIKVTVIAALTIVALAQFAWAGKVMWLPGAVLAIGTGIGGYAGSHFGVRLGPRFIRPVLVVTIVALAFRLLLAPGAP